MAVIHGNAGLGKTYAVDELVDELDTEVLWTSFPSQPTPRARRRDPVRAALRPPDAAGSLLDHHPAGRRGWPAARGSS